jgi:hypothetical protein
MIALAITSLLRARCAPVVTLCAMIVIFALSQAMTHYPVWGRSKSETTVLRATLPPLPPGSLVVFLDDSPAAYLALLASPGVRFASPNNYVAQGRSFMAPGQTGELAQRLDRAIRSQNGNLWGVETPDDFGNDADATLLYYGLKRASCQPIETTFNDSKRIRICALARDPGRS